MTRALLVLPRSLLGRMMLLYTAALALVIALGSAAFIAHKTNASVEEAEQGAQTLSLLLAPAVAEAAVIGDYDTIQRTLERVIGHPQFERAAFIDLKGAKLVVERHDHASPEPPAWLARWVAARLDEVNTPINVGGRDYGIIRLTLFSERTAADIWQVLRATVAVALVGLLGGVAMVWWPLRRWLGELDRVKVLGEQLLAGGAALQPMRTDQLPLEFQRTFEVVNRVAASLQAERTQATVTLASIAEGVATLDQAGVIVLANPVLGELLGLDSASLLGRPLGDLLPELAFSATPGAAWRGRRVTLANGWVLEASLAPMREVQGEATGWVLALRDITEQQALETQLRAELQARAKAMQAMSDMLGSRNDNGNEAPSAGFEQLSGQVGELVEKLQHQSDELHAIFQLSPDGFASFDGEGRVRFASPSFPLLTMLPNSQVVGQDEAGLEALLNGRRADPDIQRPLRLAEVQDGEKVLHMARPMQRILAFALHQGGGRDVSQLLHVRDVSQRFEVDRLKSEFLTTAAHELRTPMTSIYGFAELLMHREMPAPRQRELLQRIHRQSQAMMAILNELLDLARIEARRAQDFEFRIARLQDLVRQTVEDFGVPQGREAPLLQLPAEDLWVKVDAGKFAQALRNLLSNAYKYSPGGGSVSLRVLPTADGEADVEVQDQGIGMTEDELARVTERFFRADKSGAIPGTGLGMAIVKEIVDLMGGTLLLRSEAGVGSCMTLRLRCVLPPRAPPEAAPEQA